MQLSFCLLLSVMMSAIGLIQVGRAEDANDPAIYVVTYVDVRPPSKEEGITLLKQYREASRKDPGNMRFEILQQISRPNQFVILAMWQDQTSFETHGVAAHTAQFREKLQALRNSPNDERVHTALALAAMPAAAAGSPVYVVTHVDIIPPRKDDGMALLKQLGKDSGEDEGNERYEVLQQINRPNHFTIVESWRSQQAFEVHGMAEHTRQFRDRLQPMSGSLYDERLYQMLD